MPATKYALMKEHFDKLVLGGYPQNTGLEPIRSVYNHTFNMGINRHDIYQTSILIPTNPINAIVTLLGPAKGKDDIDIPTGLIGENENKVYYVNHITNDVFKNPDKYGKDYIENVFDTMHMMIKFDRFYLDPFKYGINNPYIATIYSYPIYFTFQHIRTALPDLMDNTAFVDIMEKYYMEKEYIPKVIEGLKTCRYTDDPQKIYSIMSCNNTISII